METSQFIPKNTRVCGIDIHKESLMACVMGNNVDSEVREFGTLTRQLIEMIDWIKSQGVTEAVIESTGIYWYTAYELLERSGIQVLVANPLRVKQIPGKKTDTQDCQWLCKLLLNGLVSGSFIPGPEVRYLRELARHRFRYVRQISQVKSRVVRLLESRNIKLRSLLSNISTQSGYEIIQLLIEGEDDLEKYQNCLKSRAKRHKDALSDALDGLLSESDRQMLKVLVEDWDYLSCRLEEIEHQLDEQINSELSRERDLLEKIPGVGLRSANLILSEVGNEVDKFVTADKFTNWAGLAPGNRQSGGSWYNQHTTQGNKYLRSTMVQVAWSAVRTKDSYWQGQFQHLRKRMPAKKAIIVIARKLLKLIHRVIIYKWEYVERGADGFLAQLTLRKEKQMNAAR